MSFHVENIAIGRNLNIGACRSLDLQLEYSIEVPIILVGTKPNNQLEVGSSKFSEQIGKGKLDLNSDSPSSKLNYESVNLTSIITQITDTEKDKTEYEDPNRVSKILDINSKSIKDSGEVPSLELSLKRLRGAKDIGTTVQDDRNVLRRSDSSAFSRYKEVARTWKFLLSIWFGILKNSCLHYSESLNSFCYNILVVSVQV